FLQGKKYARLTPHDKTMEGFMKRLLIILVVIALIVFAPNLYYTQQVEKHLATSANLMRSMGGSLNYSDVAITLGGSVQIKDLRIVAPGIDETMTINQLSVDTGSVFGVHKLAADVRNKRIPEQLTLAIEGIEIPLGGDTYEQMNALGTQQSESLLTAQCGDRSSFSASDFASMGYDDSVMVDTSLSYRIINNGQWLELVAKTAVQQMNDVTVTLDIALGAQSRDFMALGSAIGRAQLDELTLDYLDKGYMKRVLDFCQQQSGLERSEYLAQHLDAWQQAWTQYGFSAGENTVNAYSKFLQQPERFYLSAKPTNNADLAQFANLSPENLAYQFATTLQVNGRAAGQLDLDWIGKTTETAQPTVVQSRTTTPNTQLQRQDEPARQSIALTDLRNHLNQDITLQLTNGRTLEGRIVELLDDSLQFQSFQSGGHMIMPVKYTLIEEAYLK
ncbi:MAG TPA: hypothetical protein VIC08_07655, partial [Cellvibrionaceae bacterium]